VGHGEDELFPDAATWEPNPPSNISVEEVADNVAWGQRRDAIADAMWNNRGHYHV
jgi:hypothetical protein